jgi:glycosyltransferase involved in cell wall biosynthesis
VRKCKQNLFIFVSGGKFMAIKYSLVIPAYNEEPVINETHKRVTKVMQSLDGDYEIIYINDGSQDKTRDIIEELIAKDRHVRLLDFSRNFGHQPAVSAGLDHAQGDAIIIIDADLQDPPEVIPEMVEKWKEGYDVVYGQRLKRKGETFFKKITAKLFYRTLSSMTSVDIPVDTGDFRLIDKSVCEVFKRLTEKNRYIRGLVSWIGFRQTCVKYVRDERFAGETKYPLKKMIKFASDGILSFSYKPLRFATYFGILLSAASFIYLILVIIQKLAGITFAWGWPSIIAILLFFNGINLLMMGIIGEYIGRIYDETKNRPLYIIREKLGYQDDEDR